MLPESRKIDYWIGTLLGEQDSLSAGKVDSPPAYNGRRFEGLPRHTSPF